MIYKWEIESEGKAVMRMPPRVRGGGCCEPDSSIEL